MTESRIIAEIDKELAEKHEQLKKLKSLVEEKSKNIQKQIEEMMADIQSVRTRK